MFRFLLIACCFAIASPAWPADEATVARARTHALLQLETARRERARKKPAADVYEECRSFSIDTGAPLVVVVGSRRDDLGGGEWVVVSQPSGFGGLTSGIVVSRKGYWLATLPATATARDIEEVLSRPMPIATSTSFLAPSGQARAAPTAMSC